MKAWLRRMSREPLVAFFGVALALFALHGARASDPARIVVSRAEVLRAQRARLGRAPTEAELEGAIARAVESEALVREARRLGLAEEDPIVRRRLAQKMELIAEDLAALEPPSDEALQEHLSSHPERYRRPERRTVRHVFVEGGEAEAQQILRQLQGGAAPEGLGRPFAAGRVFRARTEAALGRILGADVARAAFVADEGAWTGPARSVYGWHLLRIESVAPGGSPPLEEVRAEVERDLERARRAAARDDVRARAVERFEVEVGP